MNDATTIYIAHSERDAGAASALEAFLYESIELPDGAVRIELPPGADDHGSEESKCSAIESADAVIALVSADASAGRGVMFEIGAARASGKLVFLFFTEGVDFRDMPSMMSSYPSVGICETDSHIALMETAHDIADFLGLPMKKRGNALDAIERLVEESRARESGPAVESETYDFNFTTPGDENDEQCSVVCTYEIVSLGPPTGGRVVIHTTWGELFRSFATYLDHPQEDEYIKKLIVEFCKNKDAAFLQNCQYGVYKKPQVDAYSYHRITEYFTSRELIAQAKPPRSAFQKKNDARVHWTITDRGADYLRLTLATHKALQEWDGRGGHAPRGAVRKINKQDLG